MEVSETLLQTAIFLTKQHGNGSVMMLRRKIGLKQDEAMLLIRAMQERGVIGEFSGSKGFPLLPDQKCEQCGSIMTTDEVVLERCFRCG